jgi:hypothetical protein
MKYFLILLFTLSNTLFAQIVSVKQQWQLIGLNANDAVLKNLDDSTCTDSIWGYDGNWSAYSTDENDTLLYSSIGLEDIKQLDEGKGYWLKSNGSCEVNFGFTDLNNSQINIKDGWHIQGVSRPINDMSLFDGSCAKIIWKYSDEEGWQAYSPDENITNSLNHYHIDIMSSLNKNEGYWVLGNTECVVDFENAPINLPNTFVDEKKALDITGDYKIYGLTQDELKEIDERLVKQGIATLKADIALNSTLFLDPQKTSREKILARNKLAKEAFEELQTIVNENQAFIQTLEARINARTSSRVLARSIFDYGPLGMLKSMYQGVNNAVFTAIDTTAQIAEHFASPQSVADSLDFMERASATVRDTSFLTVQVMGLFVTAGSAGAGVAAVNALTKLQKVGKVLEIASNGMSMLNSVVSVSKSGAELFIGRGNEVSRYLDQGVFKALAYVDEATNIFAIGKIAKTGLGGLAKIDTKDFISTATYLTAKEVDLALDGKLKLGANEFKITGAAIDYKNTFEEIAKKRADFYSEKDTSTSIKDDDLLLLDGDYIDYEDNRTKISSNGIEETSQEVFRKILPDSGSLIEDKYYNPDDDIVFGEGFAKNYGVYKNCPGTITTEGDAKYCEIDADPDIFTKDHYKLLLSRTTTSSEYIYQINKKIGQDGEKNSYGNWALSSLIKTNGIVTNQKSYKYGALKLEKRFDANGNLIENTNYKVVGIANSIWTRRESFGSDGSSSLYLYDVVDIGVNSKYFQYELIYSERKYADGDLDTYRYGYEVSSKINQYNTSVHVVDFYTLSGRRYKANGDIKSYSNYKKMKDEQTGSFFSILSSSYDGYRISNYEIVKERYVSEDDPNFGYKNMLKYEVVFSLGGDLNAPVQSVADYDVFVDSDNGKAYSLVKSKITYDRDGTVTGYEEYESVLGNDGKWYAQKINN